MEVFEFVHDDGVKAGCCNYQVTRTYWLADNREQAEEEIESVTPDGYEDHGNCANCFADLMANDGYEVSDK